jgi:ABC-type transport system involved in multi-copper enzyme maturation permease subunit
MSLLHAEYLKLSRRRLYLVMVLILAALVGLLAGLFLVFPQIAPDLAAEGDLPIIEKPAAYLFGAQQVAGQTWFPLILAVVMLGSEFGSTVWATALTRDSRRIPQLSARFLVLAVASWLAITLGIAGWAVVTALAGTGEGGLGTGDWLGLVWKVGLIELAWTAIGLGAVAMLRSVGPAIGAALAFFFVDSLLILWSPYQNISLSAATTALFQITIPGDFGQFFGGGALSLGHSVVIMLGWTAIGLFLSWWGLHRRDA